MKLTAPTNITARVFLKQLNIRGLFQAKYMPMHQWLDLRGKLEETPGFDMILPVNKNEFHSHMFPSMSGNGSACPDPLLHRYKLLICDLIHP